jgi:hypothetical protein
MTLLTVPERHPFRVVAALGLLFLAAYLASLVIVPKPAGRLVIGDALHHYVQLRSMVFDRDLHFRNEYVRLYGLSGDEPGTEWVYESTPTGKVRNLMPVGPALLWAPAFLMVTSVVWAADAMGAAYPLDGYGRVFQATAGVTGVVAAAAGVWLTTLACARLFSPRAAVWSALVLWLSSSAIYYSLVSPTYSHAASLLATSAFWYAFIRTRHSEDAARYVVLGALAGVCALMRWQDAVILVVPALDLVWRWRTELHASRAVGYGIVCLASALIVFTPQMLVWQALYGRPFALPQGEGFMRWTQPALGAILFSDWHGLLTWTPTVAVALAGLALLARRDALTAAAAMLFFAASWYVNAAVADWWAGEAFGARRFVSCFPVFALGLAALIDRWSSSLKTLAIASGAAVAHTFLLLLQYQAFMHGLREVAPYPRGAYGLWLARFIVPFDLVAWWWRR